MKITAIIPSYDRREWMQRTADQVAPLVDEIWTLYQPKELPLGSAFARKVLMERAVREGGDIVLSLDDDCTFLDGHSVRWAAEHFEEDPSVGMVQLTNRRRDPKDNATRRTHLYHVFMIRSEVVREGLNYRPGEYLDEVEYSMRAWLAGWRLLRTQRCYIKHRVTRRGHIDPVGGGNEAAWQSGRVPIQTWVPEYIDAGLWRADEDTRGGVRLPRMGKRFGPTKKGRRVHKEAYRERWQ